MTSADIVQLFYGWTHNYDSKSVSLMKRISITRYIYLSCRVRIPISFRKSKLLLKGEL